MIQPNLVLGGQNGQTKRNFGEGFVERSQLSVRLGCSLDAIVQDKRKGVWLDTLLIFTLTPPAKPPPMARLGGGGGWGGGVGGGGGLGGYLSGSWICRTNN